MRGAYAHSGGGSYDPQALPALWEAHPLRDGVLRGLHADSLCTKADTKSRQRRRQAVPRILPQRCMETHKPCKAYRRILSMRSRMQGLHRASGRGTSYQADPDTGGLGTPSGLGQSGGGLCPLPQPPTSALTWGRSEFWQAFPTVNGVPLFCSKNSLNRLKSYD